MPQRLRVADTMEVARRIASRFRYVDDYGPVGNAAPWPLFTDADYLLIGGDCGAAAAAIATILISRGHPFRILQVNVVAGGAKHIMVEAQDDDQRWVLIDPLGGHGFPSPRDGRLLGIEEIRALLPDQRTSLAEEFRAGDYSLFNPYRRTNWTRLGPLAGIAQAVAGDEAMRETSFRAVMMQAERRLAEFALFGVILLVIARLLARSVARFLPKAARDAT